MNWSTVALLFFAWQMLSNNSKSSPTIQDVVPFLNDDAKGILDGVTKLSSPTASNEDKTGAIFQMMTNPTVMSFAQNLFGGDKPSQPSDCQGQTATGAPDATSAPRQQSCNYYPACPQTDNATTSFDGTTFSQQTTPPQNDEGYTFASPTERAKQFFAPIDAIATAEVKHKLCYFYDHWYLTK